MHLNTTTHRFTDHTFALITLGGALAADIYCLASHQHQILTGNFALGALLIGLSYLERFKRHKKPMSTITAILFLVALCIGFSIFHGFVSAVSGIHGSPPAAFAHGGISLVLCIATFVEAKSILQFKTEEEAIS